jgi:hypothetical protein
MLVMWRPDAEVGTVQAPPRQEIPFVAKKPQIAVQVGPTSKGGREGKCVNYDNGTGQPRSRS